jgi:hypothetical protein
VYYLMADEQTKREEDRINRTLNNIGKRSARPMSWNVTGIIKIQRLGMQIVSCYWTLMHDKAPPANLHGVGSIGRNTNATAIKTIQEQIREEERKQQALNAQQAHASAQQATHAPHHTDSSFGGYATFTQVITLSYIIFAIVSFPYHHFAFECNPKGMPLTKGLYSIITCLIVF